MHALKLAVLTAVPIPACLFQADAALLIVDGSPGGFEAGFEPAAPGSAAGGGQTREHAQVGVGPPWLLLPSGRRALAPLCNPCRRQAKLGCPDYWPLVHSSSRLHPAGSLRHMPTLQLARSLGVEQVAVVVTKLDTCDFSRERFEAIR